MPKNINVVLDDEQQGILEEIARLYRQTLKGNAPAAAEILQAAINTGLRRDLATLRRAASLTGRFHS